MIAHLASSSPMDTSFVTSISSLTLNPRARPFKPTKLEHTTLDHATNKISYFIESLKRSPLWNSYYSKKLVYCTSMTRNPKFSDLPTELRLKIWSYTIPEDRIIEIRAIRREQDVVTVARAPIPPILHVNHESRAFAKAKYYDTLRIPYFAHNVRPELSQKMKDQRRSLPTFKVGWKLGGSVFTTYINWERDIIYIQRKHVQEVAGGGGIYFMLGEEVLSAPGSGTVKELKRLVIGMDDLSFDEEDLSYVAESCGYLESLRHIVVTDRELKHIGKEMEETYRENELSDSCFLVELRMRDREMTGHWNATKRSGGGWDWDWFS